VLHVSTLERLGSFGNVSLCSLIVAKDAFHPATCHRSEIVALLDRGAAFFISIESAWANPTWL
jgi:hypothetical protein